MNFDEYQSNARKTAQYPNIGKNIIYPTLGLSDEAGEVAGKVKKMLRDDGGILSDERKASLRLELGDVLWYVAALASELGLTLSDIAHGNIEKLQSRKERGVIGGSGDNR